MALGWACPQRDGVRNGEGQRESIPIAAPIKAHAMTGEHPKLKRGRLPIRAPERAAAPIQGKAVPEQAVERREGTRWRSAPRARQCPGKRQLALRLSNPKPPNKAPHPRAQVSFHGLVEPPGLSKWLSGASRAVQMGLWSLPGCLNGSLGPPGLFHGFSGPSRAVQMGL